jgi:3-hydroxyisobutyrate dehydrogenase-like beta-hydroxyacid dehydrogenase
VARAAELGVTLHASAPAAARDAHIVVSAVTASQAEPVAEAARTYLAAGQIFLDVNSAAPSTKQRAARHVEAAGAHYVEGAVMAPVLRPGLKVPILAGGPRAAETAELLNGLGMNLTPVSTEHGIASAMKLCRSIVIKGLEALMVDCAAASEAWGVKDPVFASLAATFPSIDWHALAADMRERVATHGLRRSAEMREAGEMLAALGMSPGLANAVADAQQRGARRKAAEND